MPVHASVGNPFSFIFTKNKTKMWKIQLASVRAVAEHGRTAGCYFLWRKKKLNKQITTIICFLLRFVFSLNWKRKRMAKLWEENGKWHGRRGGNVRHRRLLFSNWQPVQRAVLWTWREGGQSSVAVQRCQVMTWHQPLQMVVFHCKSPLSN